MNKRTAGLYEFSIEELANLVVLQPPVNDKVDPLILIDVRPSSEFETSHILGSINAPISKIPEDLKDPLLFFSLFEKCFVSSKDVAVFQWRNIGTVCCVGDLEVTRKITEFLQIEKKAKFSPFCNFSFSNFSKCCPHLITNESFRRYEFPTHVLPNLYVGSKESAGNKYVLKLMGIHHIVNCTTEVPCFFEKENVVYHHLPIEDDPKQVLHLKETVDFIEKNIQHHKILIHCVAGRSRSASVCIEYLKRKGMNFEEAHEFLKKKRPLISINSGFIKQLSEK
jgi:hypothetical protein